MTSGLEAQWSTKFRRLKLRAVLYLVLAAVRKGVGWGWGAGGSKGVAACKAGRVQQFCVCADVCFGRIGGASSTVVVLVT